MPAPVACDDDAVSGSARSHVVIRTEAGRAYLVRVGGFSATTGGRGAVSFVSTPDCRTDHDHSGASDLLDIFAYLTDWFAGCP